MCLHLRGVLPCSTCSCFNFVFSVCLSYHAPLFLPHRLSSFFHPASQVLGGIEEQRARDSSRSQDSDPVIASINLADRLHSPETLEKARDDPDKELDARDGFHGSQLTDKQASNREGGEAEGGVAHTISDTGNGLHPSTAGEMDRSKPAEQQGGDLGPAEEKEAKGKEEKREVEEATEALEMEDEGEEEEEENTQEIDSAFCDTALPVETVVSGAQQHQEASAEETQVYVQTCWPLMILRIWFWNFK